MRAEERGLDHGLGRVDFVRKTLILGEFANERQHEPGFTGSGRPDLQIGPGVVGAVSAIEAPCDAGRLKIAPNCV